MRYINLEKLLEQRDKWGEGAELWKNAILKEDFKNYFYSKCWYTEVSFAGFDIDIDHFRPKSAIKQYKDYYYNSELCDCGYYWLKNDVLNYRASCTFSNRPRGEGGKREWFPLKNESPLLTEGGQEVEIPFLLDPCIREDVELISFMGNEIKSTSTDPFNAERVKVSSELYNLVHTDIKSKRIKVWNEVEKTLEEYEATDISEGVCLRRLGELVYRNSEFSACAISAVKSLAPDEIKNKLDLEL